MFYCGGGASGDYDVFGKAVYDKVKKINDEGKYLPIWGTCLGFEDLAIFASDSGRNILTGGLDSDDENYSLHFLIDPEHTKLFGPLGNDASIFNKAKITYNHHQFGVEPEAFRRDKSLGEVFYPTALSYDNKGRAFVATMESKKYPFYGVQFHPEKA